MGLFRPQRPGGEVDPHLDLKILLFFVAAVLAVAGMLTGSPWTIYAAILVIVVGLLLRFLPGRGNEGGQGEEPGGE